MEGPSEYLVQTEMREELLLDDDGDDHSTLVVDDMNTDADH